MTQEQFEYKPKPTTTFLRLADFPPTIIGTSLSVIIIGLGIESLSKNEPFGIFQLVISLVAFLFIILLFLSAIRLAFGSKVTLTKDKFVYEFFPNLGLSQKKNIKINISEVKRIERTGEILRLRGQSGSSNDTHAFHFLTFIYKDNKKQKIKLHSWHGKEFQKLFENMKKMYPHISFVNKGNKGNLRRISYKEFN